MYMASFKVKNILYIRQISGSVWTSIERPPNTSSLIQIDFRPQVSITETYFPSFSVSTFFANFGGSLGLWLGVGAVQILENVLQFSKWLKKGTLKKSKKQQIQMLRSFHQSFK